MKTKAILITLFVITLLSFKSYNSNAQILNFEKYRLDADTSNVWMGKIGLWFSYKKQQTNVFASNNNLNLAYLSEKNSYMLLGYSKLISVAQSDVISEGYLHLRLNFLRRKFISIEQFNQIQYDYGRGMNQRGLIGLGGRCELISNEKTELAISSGLMYEDEIWANIDGDLFYNTNLKSSTSVIFNYKIAKWLNFIGISYFQTRLDGFDKSRIITDASLNFKFSQKFSYNLQYIATFDQAPLIDIDKLIYTFNNTISYKFH